MYLCINITGGVLTGSEVSTVAACPITDYIAAPQTQFADLPTLTDIFSIPLVDDLQTLWMLGFSLPLTCYLTAWAFQAIISWFNHEPHY